MGLLFAFAQSLCWAGTTIILRSLSTRLDAFALNGMRAFFALLIILPVIWLTGSAADYAMVTTTRLAYLVGSVLLGGVLGDALYVMSLEVLGVGRAFPIANSSPLFTVLFSTLLLRSPIGWQTLVGMVLVLLGVYLVARPRQRAVRVAIPRAGVYLASSQTLKGITLATLAAALWGLNTVVMAFGLQGGISPLVATSVRIPAVVFISLIATTMRGGWAQVRRMGGRTLLLIALGGILGWAAAASLYAAAIQAIGPSRTAIISATAPLFGVPLSLIFLGERPTRYTLIGTLLSVMGIALVI